jgi:hypothetical protein
MPDTKPSEDSQKLDELQRKADRQKSEWPKDPDSDASADPLASE